MGMAGEEIDGRAEDWEKKNHGATADPLGSLRVLSHARRGSYSATIHEAWRAKTPKKTGISLAHLYFSDFLIGLG